MFLQPTFFPIAEYSKQRGNVALNAHVASPTYTPSAGQGRGGQGGQSAPISYLDVSSTYNPQDRAVYVNVLNRSKDKDIATAIECQEGKLGKQVEVWQMNHQDLKATHTFGDDRKLVPSTKSMQADVSNNAIRYTFPAHSLTILKLKVDPSAL
jgi:alpha-N-arabinofuranosidase